MPHWDRRQERNSADPSRSRKRSRSSFRRFAQANRRPTSFHSRWEASAGRTKRAARPTRETRRRHFWSLIRSVPEKSGIYAPCLLRRLLSSGFRADVIRVAARLMLDDFSRQGTFLRRLERQSRRLFLPWSSTRRLLDVVHPLDTEQRFRLREDTIVAKTKVLA